MIALRDSRLEEGEKSGSRKNCGKGEGLSYLTMSPAVLVSLPRIKERGRGERLSLNCSSLFSFGRGEEK